MTARRLIAATARADVPNKVIQGWQDSALESLRLTVLSKQETSPARPWVAGGGSVTTTEATLTAKVDEVHRTASGVALGSVITGAVRDHALLAASRIAGC